MTTSLSAAEFGPPPNAMLSLDKLPTSTISSMNEVASGKIAGANVLIQRTASRSISKPLACRT